MFPLGKITGHCMISRVIASRNSSGGVEPDNILLQESVVLGTPSVHITVSRDVLVLDRVAVGSDSVLYRLVYRDDRVVAT